MRMSGRGALVGAAVGAMARSGVVLLNIGAPLPFEFLLPSAMIGILVGCIAGGTGKPVRGALLGALLSGVVFELFMLSCASIIGTFASLGGDNHAQGNFLRQTLVYGLQMAGAGALAGGIGGLVAKSSAPAKLNGSPNQSQTDNPGPEAPR